MARNRLTRDRRTRDPGLRTRLTGTRLTLLPVLSLLALITPLIVARIVSLIVTLVVPLIAPAAIVLSGRRLQRRDGAGTILDDPFERARAALVEVEPARHRLEAHLQALHLERVARHFDDEVVDHLVVQRVELLALGPPLGVALVEIRLDVERLDQRVRVEEQLEERPQQGADPLDRSAVRLVERVLAERIVGRR